MSSERRIVLPSTGNPALEIVARILEAEETARELVRLRQPPVFEVPEVVTAEAVNVEPVPALEPPIVKLPSLKTLTVDEDDYVVKRWWSIIKSSVQGTLRELTIRSPSTAFSITIESDGELKLSRTYAELAEMSPYIKTIDAFEEEGIHVAHLEDFNWLKSFLLKIKVTEPITFHNVFCIYEETTNQ